MVGSNLSHLLPTVYQTSTSINLKPNLRYKIPENTTNKIRSKANQLKHLNLLHLIFFFFTINAQSSILIALVGPIGHKQCIEPNV